MYAATLSLPPSAALPRRQASGRAATVAQPASVDSTELLRGQKAVEITHNGLVYRLQATKLGKLILTK